MNGAGLGSKYLVEAGKTVQIVTCSFCGSSCSRHGSMAPCILSAGFDFSGCGDFTSCPPVEPAGMSNSEPSAIVLHGIPCIGGLYTSFDSKREGRSLQGSPQCTRTSQPRDTVPLIAAKQFMPASKAPR